MRAIQAYRYALDLTPAQQRDVLAHAGAARVAHNWALARVKAVMGQIPASAATCAIGLPASTRSHSLRLPSKVSGEFGWLDTCSIVS